jgi:vesicle-fusing ATPase
MEVGFLRPKQEIADQFSADEMAKNFLKAFGGQVFATGEILMFDFRGISLRATIVGLRTLELADAQKRGGGAPSNMGLLMDKTDVSFIKAGDSSIKLKSSAKKCVNTLVPPSFD